MECKSRPMALARLLVDMTNTFLRCFSLSSWVKRALTTYNGLELSLAVARKEEPTRNASDGSVPAIAPARAEVSDSTSSRSI